MESRLRRPGIKVAVVDTGIDRTHPDFEDRVIAVRDFTNSSPGGTTATATARTSPAPSPAAAAPPAAATSAWRRKRWLLVAKVLTDNGSGMTSDVMAGVDWAVQQGAR